MANLDAKDPTSPSEERAKLVRAGTLHWLHWFVLCLSLLLTFTAWYFTKEQITERVRGRFAREASQVVAIVQERMTLYENALAGAAAHLDASGEISHGYWETYSRSLNLEQTYPGINGIGVIHHVAPPAFEDYMLRMRRERPDYRVHPEHDQEERWPISYIEPLETNKKAVGLDVAFETNRRTSIRRARDTGSSQITGPIVLVQDQKRTPGFLLYVPVYSGGGKPQTLAGRKEKVLGAVFAPFIVEKLMRGTLDRKKRHVALTIADGTEVLFRDDLKGGDPNPLFSETISVDMYGRTWTFKIDSDLGFRAGVNNAQPYVILVGGILLDSMLLAMFLMLTHANRRALAYADDMTLALRAQTIALQKTNDDLDEFAYVASHDLKAPLRAIDRLAGWIARDTGEALSEKSTRWLTTLRSRVERLEILLEDLLAYSRAGRTEEVLGQVDLRQAVKGAFQLMGAAPAFTLVGAETLPTIETSKGALEQVFRNLIGNAIKHHDGGSGEIRVGAEPSPTGWEFFVSDDGPGIPEALHGRATEMFKTLKPRDAVEGSGMGLAIVKRLIEFHGGSVRLESTAESGGLTVRFSWKAGRL